jgi:enoyl-CoA hydratase
MKTEISIADRLFGDVLALTPDKDAVAVLQLNRPQVLNAVREDTFTGLRDAARWLTTLPHCNVIVLRAAGRAFCAGLDLTQGLTGTEEGDRASLNHRAISAGAEAVATLREIPQPVIAAVRGAAVGAGFSIAAAATIRICSPDAKFGAPFVHVGMSAGDLGLSWILPRLMGTTNATSLLLTGGSLTAEQALAGGVVTEIVEDPEERAVALARHVASQPRLATFMTKTLLHASASAGFREHLATEVSAQAVGSMTAEHAQAIEAFSRRRQSKSIVER